MRGRYPSCTDTLSFFVFLTYTYICSYTYICTYTHTYIYIYTHTWTYISPWLCTLRWGGDTPAAPFTYYPAYLGEGEIPRLHPQHIFSELCTLRWGGDTPAAPWHVLAYLHYGKTIHFLTKSFITNEQYEPRNAELYYFVYICVSIYLSTWILNE